MSAQKPQITKPCPLCSFPLTDTLSHLKCETPGCKHTEPIPPDLLLREKRARMLPGFGEES